MGVSPSWLLSEREEGKECLRVLLVLGHQHRDELTVGRRGGSEVDADHVVGGDRRDELAVAVGRDFDAGVDGAAGDALGEPFNCELGRLARR
jgi:hypothetical protein